jgi:hypothetical protein
VNAENVSGLNNSTNITNQTRLLIDGEGQVLANGEQREFYQGYAICIKGVEKKDEIFNVTIDHIYIGSQKDLVFFYVYQYLDPDLPAPVPGSLFNTTPPSNATSEAGNASATTTATTNTTTNNNTTSATHDNSSDSVPGYGRYIAIGALVSAYLVSRRIHR